MNRQRRTIIANAVVAAGVRVLAILALTSLVASPLSAVADGLRGVWGDLIRGTARVADDVPVKKVDDLVAELGKSRAARGAVETELRSAGRLAKADDVLRGAARSDEILKLLRSATADLHPSVIRRIEQLDDASREAALVVAKGGHDLRRAVPDLAARGRLVREGGAETIAAVGMFGPDAARAAMRLDEAIKAGTVVVKPGSRAVSVADFGNVMTRFGDASWKFWNTYIQPHWKVWLASGALAAYLANPEYFQDAAGQLTEAGFRHLTELAGEVAASAIRGVGEGSGRAVKEIAEATRDTILHPQYGMYSLIGTVIFLAGIALCFRRVRHWALRPLQWLNQAPKQSLIATRNADEGKPNADSASGPNGNSERPNKKSECSAS